MKEEWLFPNAVVPVDAETTAALVAEIHRLIDVVGGMALAQPAQESTGCACRWDDEGDRTVTCARHEGWLEVIAEWADRAREAEKKLKALAQPEQASVAEVMHSPEHGRNYVQYTQPIDLLDAGTKLYTSPPQRQPLTHEQRFDLLTAFKAHKHEWNSHAILIDMVEAKHGIGDKT